jgi:8-oxo-dGTP pyrophosphatase MutT (NUDIX family)
MKKEKNTMGLLEEIEHYQPFNEQEEKDKALILACLKEEPHVFTRENTRCHMTASAWVTNKERDKVLMVFHNIYHSWSWLGGHADGEEDLLQVALREVREESGVVDIRPLSKEIFSLEVLTVDGHEKKGAYVSSHLHLNVSYLLEADEKDPLFIKPDENSGIRWFTLEGAIAASSEMWFQERIYPKLNAKLRALYPPKS